MAASAEDYRKYVAIDPAPYSLPIRTFDREGFIIDEIDPERVDGCPTRQSSIEMTLRWAHRIIQRAGWSRRLGLGHASLMIKLRDEKKMSITYGPLPTERLVAFAQGTPIVERAKNEALLLVAVSRYDHEKAFFHATSLGAMKEKLVVRWSEEDKHLRIFSTVLDIGSPSAVWTEDALLQWLGGILHLTESVAKMDGEGSYYVSVEIMAESVEINFSVGLPLEKVIEEYRKYDKEDCDEIIAARAEEKPSLCMIYVGWPYQHRRSLQLSKFSDEYNWRSIAEAAKMKLKA